MLFVEQLRGNGFPTLRHATWVGLTWADTVFPCFMFLAGCSLAVVTPPVFTRRSAAIALVVLALCRPLDWLRHRAAAVAHRIVYPLSALGRHEVTIYVGQHLIGTALDRTTVGGRWLADRMAGHFAGFGGSAIATLVGPSDSWNRKSESRAGDGAHTRVNDLRRPRSVSSGGDFSQERVQ